MQLVFFRNARLIWIEDRQNCTSWRGVVLEQRNDYVAKSVRFLCSLCGPFLSLLTFSSLAQQPPPRAGEVLRDIQDKPQAVTPGPAPRIDVAPEKRRAIKPVPGLKIDVKGFRFSDATGVSEDRLRDVVQKFTGSGRTFEDLQEAADAVAEYLQIQGYFVAQAFLPEQKIEEGVVEIAVLLGRLAEVRVDIDPDVPVSRGIIDATLSHLPPGTILRADTVERALFLLSDLRGMAVRSIVEPGPTPGTANLIVKVSARKRVDGTVEFDKQGSRFTGDYRAGASMDVNSPFKRGDLLSARGLMALPGGSRELQFGRISYMSPVGSYGTRLGIAYSALNYHLGTDQFEALDQGGRADVVSLFALHPVIRARNLNVFAHAALDFRDFKDEFRAVGLQVDKRTTVAAFGAVGDSRDAYLGGGINNFALTLTTGKLDIQNADALAADQLARGPHTQGDYTRLNGTFVRLNSLAKSTILYASYSFQLASKNLDASEKIALGGPFAVRAYPVGEASSDEAHLFTLELRYGLPRMEKVPGDVVLATFFDAAHGRINRNALPLPVDNTRDLRGAGFGVTWGKQDDFNIRGTLAWRLTDAPTGDRSDRRPRLYFQLVKYL